MIADKLALDDSLTSRTVYNEVLLMSIVIPNKSYTKQERAQDLTPKKPGRKRPGKRLIETL